VNPLAYLVYFLWVVKAYGLESPPMAACVAPFAVVSTTAGFRAAYDPNGNMVLRVEVSGTQHITYTQEYNTENRLAVVTNTVTGQVTRFGYDGDGNRLLRIGPEGATVYIGDYYEKRGSVVTKYYYAAGQRVAMRVGGALYFLHGDHLGSATLTTGAGGNWMGEARYISTGRCGGITPVGCFPRTGATPGSAGTPPWASTTTGPATTTRRWGGSSARTPWCRSRGIRRG